MVKNKVAQSKAEVNGKIEVSFGARHLTHMGGAVNLFKFMDRFGIASIIEEHFCLPKRANKFTSGQLLLGLLSLPMLGLKRISHSELLRGDPLIAPLMGLKQFPSADVLFDLLGRFDGRIDAIASLLSANEACMKRARQLEDSKSSCAIVDLDSHVIPVYGSQEGAAVGYNPAKRGRKSYHPLLAFNGKTREFIMGDFRSGNMHAAASALELIENTRDALPEGTGSICWRGDSAFASERVMSHLEERQERYAFAMKATKPLQCLLGGLRYQGQKGISFAETVYCAHGWSRARRIIVIRHEEKEPQTAQGKLFDGFPGYRFQLIVTNMSGPPRAIWRFYNKRANVENMIKEAVYDMNFNNVPTARFDPNAAYFFILFFAYNILLWYQRLVLCSKAAKHLMASTMRRYFIFIAAKVVHHSRRLIVKLQDDYPFKNYFYQHQKRIDALAPLT